MVSVWTAVHTPVGLEARSVLCDTEEDAQTFLAESTGQDDLEFVDAPSRPSTDHRRIAKPSKGGSAQYWRER